MWFAYFFRSNITISAAIAVRDVKFSHIGSCVVILRKVTSVDDAFRCVPTTADGHVMNVGWGIQHERFFWWQQDLIKGLSLLHASIFLRSQLCMVSLSTIPSIVRFKLH